MSNIKNINADEAVQGNCENCWRCGGSGRLPHFAHVLNGVCFGCNGSGRQKAGKASQEGTHRQPETTKPHRLQVSHSTEISGCSVVYDVMQGGVCIGQVGRYLCAKSWFVRNRSCGLHADCYRTRDAALMSLAEWYNRSRKNEG